MIEFLALIVALVGVYIAYLAYRHQVAMAKPAEPKAPSALPKEPAAEAWHHKIPDGITFGDKVVLVPGLQVRLFTHSGRIIEDHLRPRQYTWIERGEPVGRYETLQSSGGIFSEEKWLGADIPSPVSGLIIHSSFGHFSDWPKPQRGEIVRPTMAQLAILVADDEPAPEDNGFLFDHVLRFIDRHRAPSFKPSKQWTMEGMTEDDYQRLVGYQRQAHCITVAAMPEYHDYFEEARKRYPTLRPYLDHLR